MDYKSLIVGAFLGILVTVISHYIKSKYENNQKIKTTKRQKLEELLKLLEIENKESLMLVSIHSEDNTTEKISILKNTLKNNFENQEIIRNSEENYAKIKTITSIYINKLKNNIDNHIKYIQGKNMFEQISIKNAISTSNLTLELDSEDSITNNEVIKRIIELDKSFQKDKSNQEKNKKLVDISLDKIKNDIIKEINI